MDYKNGRIYKITSDSTDKIYIGSTCQPLCKRIAKHKHSYKRFQNGKSGNITSFEVIALGDAIITLIEAYPCESKEQLLAKERYHIELNKDICVNKQIPSRTQKEYQETNKEHLAQIGKEYREANKEHIAQIGKEYREANKDKLKEIKKTYYDANKEKIKEKITCECGGRYTLTSKLKHNRTKKHLAYMQSTS